MRICHLRTTYVSLYDTQQHWIFKMAAVQTGGAPFSLLDNDRNKIPNAEWVFSRSPNLMNIRPTLTDNGFQDGGRPNRKCTFLRIGQRWERNSKCLVCYRDPKLINIRPTLSDADRHRISRWRSSSRKYVQIVHLSFLYRYRNFPSLNLHQMQTRAFWLHMFRNEFSNVIDNI